MDAKYNRIATVIYSFCLVWFGTVESIAQYPGNKAPLGVDSRLEDSLSPRLTARTLEVFSSIPLSVPPFGFFGSPQCDATGRMFFEAGTPPSNDRIYLAISADGQRQTIYALPKDILDQPHNTLAYLSAGGEVHFLAMLPGKSLKWLTFDEGGKLEHVVGLNAPTSLVMDSFAVTAGGYLMLLGYYPEGDKHSNVEGTTYRAIFSPSGDVVTQLPSERAAIAADSDPQRMREVHVKTDGDHFYWTTGKIIYDLDSSGAVVRKIDIPKANESDQVLDIGMSGPMAEVTLASGPPWRTSYLVLNSITGDAYWLYLPPEGSHMKLACFDSKRGFTFLVYENKRLRFEQAILP